MKTAGRPQLLGTIKRVSDPDVNERSAWFPCRPFFVFAPYFAVFANSPPPRRVLRFFGPVITWVMGSAVIWRLLAGFLCFFVSLPLWVNERSDLSDGHYVKRV